MQHIGGIGEERKEDGRWQRKTKPCRQSTYQSGSHDPQGDAHLAASWTRQKLAEPNQVPVGAFIDPFAADDYFLAKVPKMSDRTAKGCQTQPGKDDEYLWK